MPKLKRWILKSSKPIYESKWLSLYDNSYELPNGNVGENYLHLKRRDFVLIVARNRSNQILVERTYRRGVDDFVYELPAGLIDEGESPLTAAKRELSEETGFTGEGSVVNYIYPQPGYMEEKAYIVFVKVEAKAKETNLSPDEQLEIEWWAIDELRNRIAKGDIKDMGFLSAIASCDHLLR